MSTSSTAIFTGTSRYTNDFQQVISRAVAIASLPITQLNYQKSFLSSQATAVSSLDTKFSALQSALQNLGNSTGLSSLTTTLSDSSIARVTLGAGAAPATYSLEVINLGAYTNTLSASTASRVSDPASQNVSSASSFTVTINGVATRITPGANNLNSLVDALNTTPGLGVQASLVNLGSTDSPDYRLSVQSTKLGATSIQLNDGTTDLLDTTSTGSLASYKVNGAGVAISSNSRTVTLAPGVTAELLGASPAGVAATIGVTRSPTSIGNALSALVNSFNAAADELDQHRGKAGGALTGNSLISELGNKLRAIGGYSNGGGPVSSLADLGISFDGKGHLTYDSAAFSAKATDNLAAITAFLGSTTGGGFLQSASDVITSVEDVTTGTLKRAGTSLQDQINDQQNRIDTNQARVDQLTANLQAQLAKADALVAGLEQSYAVLSGIFAAQRASLNK